MSSVAVLLPTSLLYNTDDSDDLALLHLHPIRPRAGGWVTSVSQ